MLDFELLDGPIGTQLNARGIETPLPFWSAGVIRTHPDVLAAIHRDYADAGATIHTANTFRTRNRTVGPQWRQLTDRAVAIARQAVPKSHRIAGSLAPLEDCYRPDLSPVLTAPERCRAEHQEMADQLADAGCDIILCETFPHPKEALVAVRCAVSTGIPTWLSLTAGPQGDLLSPDVVARTAREAVQLGVQAVLVNCTPAKQLSHWIDALSQADLGVPFGGYANAGALDEGLGWDTQDAASANRYLSCARQWLASGATLIGGCCGTGPAHIAALKSLHQQK